MTDRDKRALARARKAVGNATNQWDSDDDEISSARALLQYGELNDWLTLAQGGHYDAVQGLLADNSASGNDHPLVRAAAVVLALGFFFPRPKRLISDLRRAQLVLTGGEWAGHSWNGVSRGVPESPYTGEGRRYQERGILGEPIVGSLSEHLSSFEPGQKNRKLAGSDLEYRMGHIELPLPIIHPATFGTLAAEMGCSAAALQAVLEGTAYLDNHRRPVQIPWYPEQESEARALAERRAENQGPAVPTRLLDQPYESSYYMARSGLSGLVRACGDIRVDTVVDGGIEQLAISVVPLLPAALRLPERMPGGSLMPGPRNRGYELLMHVLYRTGSEIPPSYQRSVTHQLQRGLQEVFETFAGLEGSQREYAAEIVSGAPPAAAGENSEQAVCQSREELMQLIDVRFVDEDSLLFVFPRLLAWLGVDGSLRATWHYRGSVEHVGPNGHVLVKDADQFRVLALKDGRWLEQVSLESLQDTGAFEGPPYPDPFYHHFEHYEDDSNFWIYGIYSPDRRFMLQSTCEMIGGIFRVSDFIRVADAGEVLQHIEDGDDEYDDEDREYYEEVDQYDAGGPTTPVLLSVEELAALGSDSAAAWSKVIDGIRFTVHSEASVRVAGTVPIAFQLDADDQWVIWHKNSIHRAGQPLLKFGTDITMLAFHRAGKRAVALSETQAHLLQLKPKPKLLKHLCLASLERLFGLGPELPAAAATALLESLGSVFGVSSSDASTVASLGRLDLERARELIERCQKSVEAPLSFKWQKRRGRR